MYWGGLMFGIPVFTYDKRHGQVKLSRPIRVLFPVIKSISALSHIAYNVMALYYYDNIILQITFSAQSFTFVSFSMLLVISQIMQPQKYIDIINESISLVKTVKIKVRSENFFDRTFLLFVLVKTLTNFYVIFNNIPYIIDSNIPWTVRLAVVNMTVLFLTNVIFFNFGFVGLLVTSALQTNLYEYFQSCTKIRDFEEFSRIYGQFKVIFKQFTKLTELQFFFGILFYLVHFGASLIYLVIDEEPSSNKSATLGSQICCIIDLMIFNLAADLVEKTSRKMDFFKVDFLCNDSLEVRSY